MAPSLPVRALVACTMLTSTVLTLPFVALGCGQSPPASVGIEDWCARMETAIRDRAVRCECPGAPLDDAEIEARCAALPAATLIAAFEAEEVGWNGTIAAARVAAIDGCDDPEVYDSPVLGRAQPGEPCRVFEDTWGRLNDCDYGSICAAPLGGGEARCVAVVRDGESCDEAHVCEPGLACTDGSCARSPLGAAGDPCTSAGECRSRVCEGGSCAALACAPTLGAP